jgi:hypothetical protein
LLTLGRYGGSILRWTATFRIVRCRAGLSKRNVGCPHMLRPNANRNHAVAESARKSFLDQFLHPLRKPRGERTAALDLRKIAGADSALAKGSRQHIGRRDRVLNGKIDPDAPHGRHGVSRIPDAHKSRAMPQAIHPDGQ